MGKLIPATIDFETYFDDDYSLRKMTPEEYVRDPRFQITGCALQPHGKRSIYITADTEDEIKDRLRQVQWGKVFCVGHNMSMFDSLILTERVGVRPKFWGCTLAMARQCIGGKQLSLGALAERFDLQEKQTDILMRMKGKRLEDMTPEDKRLMTIYGNGDAEICTALFYLFKPHIPPEDLRLIHWFTRMFAEPRIHLDVRSYQTWLEQMVAAKAKLLDALGLTEKDLRSNNKFAQLLRDHGVEPPTKISKTTGKPTFAFAKTDKAMTALLEDEDELIAALAEARVKTKSSIEQSRVERFIGIGTRGPLPVPLMWGKTHTLRAAGAGKINMQNLSKGKTPTERTLPGTLIVTPNGLRTFRAMDNGLVVSNEGQKFEPDQCHSFNLRDGIKAPPGHKIVVCDSSNIELRVCHLLAGQMDTVEKLRNGEDLYCWFASDLYGRPITKADKKERQHGKVGMLQLQYQSGAESFQNAARTMGRIILTEGDAQETVDFYRARFPMIPKLWRRCQNAIASMYRGECVAVDPAGLVTTGKNKLHLPRGRTIHYKNLRQEDDEKFGTRWVYDDRMTGAPKNLYGGAMVENICQALAGIIVMDQCMEIEMRYGRYNSPMSGVVLTVHDEGVTIVEESKAQECLAFSIKTMSTPPSWWPEVPLAAEGDIADRYGSAK